MTNLRPRRFVPELLADRHDVGHGLAGMIHVVLHREDRDVGPLGQLVLILLADAGAAVAHRDAVAVARQHHAGVLRALAVADLRGLGGQPVRVPAELRHAGLEGVARARRFLEEEHVERLGAQQMIVVPRL